MMSSIQIKESSGNASNGSPLLIKNLLKPETEVIVSSSPMSPLSFDDGLSLMGLSNLGLRIANGSPASSTCSTSLHSSPATTPDTSIRYIATPSPARRVVSSPEYGNYPLLYAKAFFASSKSNESSFIVVPDGLKVVSYDVPEGAFQTEWQRQAYEVFLMQLSLKEASKVGGPGHEGSFDADELHEDEAQARQASRDEFMLKEVLHLESWPEIYRNWMFCWKLPNGSWKVPGGLLNPSGSQKLPQVVSRVSTWTALRNQYLRRMNIDDTPFGEEEFKQFRWLVKKEHEEQLAKGWITVKTLKEQKELGEPAKKRFKEAQIMSILEKFSKKSP
ncbi:hypothetical protein L3Y34_019366 [Caenorhabditis briggsae]|uniref:Uncharacterized protein n=1 Tax=Caenorhabditis briggsae TaxID=6238 RepID=A0AAE9DPS2_CAEBR|nr:hypothetical protein L3Y34_019366 [Caenorhabditis briggsae]